MKKYLKAKNAIDAILFTYGSEEVVKKQMELFRQMKDTKYRDGFNAYHKFRYHYKVMEAMREKYHDDTTSIPAAQDPPPRETLRGAKERSVNLSTASANAVSNSITSSISVSASISFLS